MADRGEALADPVDVSLENRIGDLAERLLGVLGIESGPHLELLALAHQVELIFAGDGVDGTSGEDDQGGQTRCESSKSRGDVVH
jgi:hypothetical protein